MAANRGTMSESEQQNMEKQPSTASRNGESANKGETWEISSPKPRIMAAIWKFTKENTPNNETIMVEDESTERQNRETKPPAKSIEDRILSHKAKLEKSCITTS
jgi:hypothetical protein